MSDKEFYWFCRALKWTTNFSLMLMALIVTLLPFALYMADEKPWTGLLVFGVFIAACYVNWGDKNKIFAGKRVFRGASGTTGIMLPLWQNVVFWFLYIFMELLMAGIAISVFTKAIWSV